MKIKHSNVKPISSRWAAIIDRFLKHLRVSGQRNETIRTRREHLHFLARTIGLEPEYVTRETLIEWCADRDWATETRRGRYNSIRMFWRWAGEHSELEDVSDCLPMIKQGKAIADPAPEEVYESALASADDRTRLILRLGADYGLRRAEIAVVRVPDDLVRDLIGWTLVVHGKGGKPRLVPLEDDMAAILLAVEPGYMLPGEVDGHLSVSYVGRLASRALPGRWTLHKLRHRFATKGFAETRDLYGIQQILGHASSDTTTGYILHGMEQLRLITRATSRGRAAKSRKLDSQS